jgi:pyruvate formate-lyase/glycerol dehydratase family glycyl radical enzyme
VEARTAGLKDGLRVSRYPLCVEKITLLGESYAATRGEPTVLRRGKALAHVLDNIPIFIEPGEIIVGNVASEPMGMEIDPDYGLWSHDEIESLRADGFTLSEDDEKRLYEVYRTVDWETLIGEESQIFWPDERMRPFMKSGVVLPPWKGKIEGGGGGYAQGGMGLGPGFLLMCVDFETALSKGARGMIHDAEEALARLDSTNAEDAAKADFLTATVLAYEALIRFAGRFAALADELARTESEPARAEELRQIAERCRRVPEYPAEGFRDALQFFWFLFLLVTPSPTAAAGRFDQYMYPYYRDDLEAGRITRDEAVELLVLLRIKDMQLNRTSGTSNRKKNAGLAKWHNFTIGGVTSDGEDATNDLTYLLLDAAEESGLPHYTLTLRVHPGTPDELLNRALEVVKTGLGLPAFVGDDSYIRYFVDNGVDIRSARQYVLTGCLDANIPAESRTYALGMFVVPLVFDIFMHNGMDPNTGERVGLETGQFTSFQSYDDLLEAFKRQLAYFMGLAAERNNVEIGVSERLFPDPFRSSLMYRGIGDAQDLFKKSMPFENAAVLNPIGMVNVGDSLAAIKKLVFDEGRVSLADLQQALEADWIGYEELQDLCLEAPKYGNDDDSVDVIVADLYRFWAETTLTFRTPYGAPQQPTAISITSHQPGGALTGATPDGRHAGEILADGTMSPMQGRDTSGPTAVLRSAMKIDQHPYQATLLNMKFHPTALESEADRRKLGALIKTYFAKGGKHIQFNVVDSRELRAAQKEPDKHRDLVVRVAGYSAYFVQLPDTVQEEIIRRSEHSSAA